MNTKSFFSYFYKSRVLHILGFICILLVSSSSQRGFAQSVFKEKVGETEDISVLYAFQTPSVKHMDDYDQVTIPGLTSYGDPGAPVLPFQMARILLPFGAQVESIEVIAGEGVTLAGSYHIEPGQELIPSSKQPEETLPPDPAIYESAHFFPGELYKQVSTQTMHGYVVLLIQLYPIQYLPETGELTYYPDLTVNVKTTAKPSESITTVIASNGEERLQEFVDNPEQIASYTMANISQPAAITSLVSPSEPYDYIIITSQALSSTFQTLVTQKISNGLNAQIYTTEEIYAEYTGADDAEKVRNFIVDAYTTWSSTTSPLQYVLLGGDTEIIPIRLVRVRYSSYTTNMPVDMYYAGLDGNWDNDGDGRYGEPAGDGTEGEEVDFFAEVYVGRMPVETASEAARAISKIVYYEQNPSAAYLDQALWLGRRLDERTYGGNSKDLVSNIVPQYNVTTLYDRDGTYNTARVINEMNASTHLVNFDGHGNWSCCPLSRSEIGNLTNDYPFLFYNLGCYTAQFDGSGEEAVAEYYVFTEHGAFAYIGNTRYGWYSVGSTNGSGNQLDRLFFNYVVNTPNHNIGKALQLAKEDYYPGHRWSILTLTLLGDPETALVTELIDPVANISSPLGGKEIEGSITISGTATAGSASGANFEHYILEYGSGSNPTTWTQIGITSTTEVTEGMLGIWDTTVLQDNRYTLRLRVKGDEDHTGSHKHILTTNNTYITSPVEDTYVHSTIPLTITGSAQGTDFSDYVVEYGRGTSPSSWTTILTSTLPVFRDILAVWDPSAIVEADFYTIRLTRHGTNYNRSESVTIYIDPAWMIGWPQSMYRRTVAPTIAAGDIDGNGDLEMVTTVSQYDYTSSYVYAWQHDGRLMPGWPRYVRSNWISSPTLADIDRDGDLEILVGVSEGQVYAWHHNGQLAQGWPQNIDGEGFGSPSVADLDRNGALEVVAADLDGNVYAWSYNGNIMPGWPKASGAAIHGSPTLGDLDNSGDLEIVVARQGEIHAWHSDGTVVTDWPIMVTGIVSDVIGSPAMGDIDGNGDMEIVLAAGEAVYAWHHNGTAVSGWPKSINGKTKSSPALGDLNGDGNLEIVVGSDQVYAWDSTGTPLGGWPVSLPMHTNSSPVLGDITGDGQPDVVIGAGDKDDHIYAWEGDGSEIPGWPHFVPAFDGSDDHHERLSSPILIDLEQDGDVEVAIGGETYVFVFDLPTEYNDQNLEWPIFQHDLHYTGAYTGTSNLPPFVRNVKARPGYVVPGEMVTITAQAIDDDGIISVTAEIEAPDETVLAILTLYDDGAHGDGETNDGIYGNSWTTPSAKQDYFIDITAADGLGNTGTYNNIGSFTSEDKAYVQFKNLTISGKIYPGDNKQGAITLENIGVLNAAGVTATVSTADACILSSTTRTIIFGDIAAGSSASSNYYDFYFRVSDDCPPGRVVTFDLDIYDLASNHWSDNFQIFITGNAEPYQIYAEAMPRYVKAGQPVTITAYLDGTTTINSVQAVIESPDEIVHATLTLQNIGGRNFRGTWTTDNVPRTYQIDFIVKDALSNERNYNDTTRFTTEPFNKTTNVLLFLDNDSQSRESLLAYYRNALDATEIPYDIWDNYFYGVVPSDILQTYTGGVFIWAVPTDGNLYNTSFQEALGAYLDAGGKLFVTGQNVGSTLDGTAFYKNYLRAVYVADTVSSRELIGTLDDPIGNGLGISISGGDGANNQSILHPIEPLTQTTTILSYVEGNTSPGAAIRVETDVYKIVYFNFGFEAINSLGDRAIVMARVLDWLIHPTEAQIHIFLPFVQR